MAGMNLSRSPEGSPTDAVDLGLLLVGWYGDPMTPRSLLLLFLVATLLNSCAIIPKKIQRDTTSYVAETLAGIQREEAAAMTLLVAARHAWAVGNEAACTEYAAPALKSLTRAQAEGYRALWLADLPYPDAERWPDEPGHVPTTRVEQEDPGKPLATPPTAYVCTAAWPPDPYPAHWPPLETP